MNPCCGGSLQTGVRIIAISKLIWAVIVMLSIAMDTARQKQQVDVVLRVVVIVYGILEFFGAVCLLFGANKLKRNYAMGWFVMHSVLGICYIVNIARCPAFVTSAGPELGILLLFWVPLHCYFLWVVWAFLKEIQRGATATASQPSYANTNNLPTVLPNLYP